MFQVQTYFIDNLMLRDSDRMVMDGLGSNVKSSTGEVAFGFWWYDINSGTHSVPQSPVRPLGSTLLKTALGTFTPHSP